LDESSHLVTDAARECKRRTAVTPALLSLSTPHRFSLRRDSISQRIQAQP
jgi:hypothetical protein